jgi:PRTRC genetic system ThiF family protein
MVELPKTFDPHLHPQEIVLVGCGGTGSAVARLIARLLVHLQARRIAIPTFRIVDPDVVETANLARQQFVSAELGLGKAEVTSKRLAYVFGLPIEWACEAFNAERHVSRPHSAIVIDAVDNHVARLEIARLRGSVVVSCGNETSHGQVSIGNVSERAEIQQYLDEVAQHEKRFGAKDTLHHLPTAYALFPTLLEPELVKPIEPVSCAENVMMGSQDVYVNDAIALIAARYVQQILLRQPIKSFLCFATLDDIYSIRPVEITLSNLQSYLGEAMKPSRS